jgi:site-specific recombinase XerD
MVNKYLKQIVSKLDIDKPVTTYYARHTFATVLKRNGVSPLFISESLGHSSLKTTENYLDSFEDDQRKSILEKLKNYKTAS